MLLMFSKESSTISITEKCYHCGDDCKNIIKSEEKTFCCEGCKSVYEILNQNQLCTYYNIQQFPGKKVLSSAKQEYDFLDNETIARGLLSFRGDKISRVTFYIPNIHCSSCLWLLENISQIHPGIIRSQVNFPKKEITLVFREQTTSLRRVVEILDAIGYPPQITLAQLNKKKTTASKDLYYKLGIAGFCSGNIMLLSFPDYLGMDGIGSSFGIFFGYVSLLLSIPVFFYCASDYFTSSFNSLKNKFINIDIPIALGLIVVYGRSIYEIVSGTGTGYLDSFAGLVFFLLIGKWYQKKTFDAISFERDYKSYFPVAVTKVTETQAVSIPLEQLEKGDIILIRNNELIPADGVIIDGKGAIDYSFVTGESDIIIQKTGEEIYAGGRQTAGILKIRIEKSVSQSYFTQLWNQEVFHKHENISLFSFTNLVGKYFTIAVLLIAAGTFLYWWNVNTENAIYAFVSVVIVFCPCTFALAIPFCYSNAMKILGRKNLYLKNTETIEAIANTDTIIFDKTGTLTSSGHNNLSFHGQDLNHVEKTMVASLTQNSSHPLSKMIFQSMDTNTLYPVEDFEEVQGKGIQGSIKNMFIQMGAADFINIPNDESREGSRVYLSINQTAKGYFEISDTIRNGIPELIKNVSHQYDLHMLSGDQATQKEEMAKLFPNTANIQFEMTPSEKLHYIKNLQLAGRRVMMIGDGLNDAGALKQSDIGISVSDNAYTFTPASDAIIHAEKLGRLHDFISFCKGCSLIVKISLLVSFTYNVIGLYFAMTAQLSPMIAAILMPASSVSVVLFVITLSNLWAKKKKLLQK